MRKDHYSTSGPLVGALSSSCFPLHDNQETAFITAGIASGCEVDGFDSFLMSKCVRSSTTSRLVPTPSRSRQWANPRHLVFAWTCEWERKQFLLETGKGIAKLKVTCTSVPPLVSRTRSYVTDAHFCQVATDISSTSSVSQSVLQIQSAVHLIAQIQIRPK